MKPIFHLALVDRAGQVRLVWATTQEAHADLADSVAAKVHPGRFAKRRRLKAAETIRQHLLELQRDSVALAAEEPEAAG